MNTPHQHKDPLDALLKGQPLRPSADFTERALARLAQETTLDSVLDSHLSAQPMSVSPEFTERVLDAIEAESEKKILGFPAWVVTIGSIAALLVAGVLAFAALFHQGHKDAQEQKFARNSITSPVAEAPMLVAVQDIATQAAIPDNVQTDMSGWEELLLMQEALSNLADINDAQEWQTIAMLTN